MRGHLCITGALMDTVREHLETSTGTLMYVVRGHLWITGTLMEPVRGNLCFQYEDADESSTGTRMDPVRGLLRI